ncbi:MAG: SpoIIE family protein phosphatase [Actinomycetes bacterium]
MTLPPEGTSVGAARRLVRRALAGWGQTDLVDTAVLLTSELVTNAVVHAGTEVEIGCAVRDAAVEVEVLDRYPARAMPLLPVAPPPDAEGGRGLALAAALASSWGVEYTSTHKRVWFRLERGELDGSLLPAEGAGLPAPRREGGSAEDPDARVAVVRTDATGRVGYWSQEATSLFGWAAEEVDGRPLAELVHWPRQAGQDGPAGAPADLVLGLPRWQGTYEVHCADGETLPVFAVHVRTGSGQGDRAAVCLMVAEQHRWVLGASIVRQKVPIRGAAPDPGGPSLTREAPASPGEPHERQVGDPLPRSGADPMHRPTGGALSGDGVDTLLGRLAERGRDLLDGDAAYALLSTEDDDLLEVRASTGLGHRATGRYVVVESLDDLPGGSSSVPVIRHDDAGHTPVLRETGMQSLVAVPLTVEDRVIGSLGVAARETDRFVTDDVVRLQSLADQVALSVEGARLTELDRRRRGWLGFLAEASDLLAGTLDPDMTMAMVAQLVVPRLARWCAIHALDDSGGRLAYVWHEDESRVDGLRAALSALPPPGTSAAGRRPSVVVWPDGDAVLTVSLAARGRRIGTLTLGRPGVMRFRQDDVELVEDLARRAGLALDNARLYADRTQANRALQRSLLPPRLPDVPGCDVGVAYAAAGEGNEVGGDFYDLFPVREGRWGFAVGDVCGKGAEAAAVTGLARHALRLLGRKGDPLPDVLAQLNEAVLEEAGGERFITLLYGEIEPSRDGGARIEFVSAGHPLPMRVQPDGTVITIGNPQTLLGVLPGETFRTEECWLAPGEAFVAVTDGVIERREDGEMFGESGLVRVLSETPGLPASAVADRVESAVLAYHPSTPRDDMAVLVIRALTTG